MTRLLPLATVIWLLALLVAVPGAQQAPARRTRQHSAAARRTPGPRELASRVAVHAV